MNDTILVGQGRTITSITRKEWEGHLSKIPEHFKIRLGFMTPEHHLVRYFVVSELLRMGVPIEPETISKKLNLSLTIVSDILDQLEKRLFFLVRNEQGAVSWAFPVTVDKTAHRLRFDTGEALYAAWAEDAMAAPFVQGRLRRERLSVTIETECGHCALPMSITVDSDLNSRVNSDGAEPLLFEPEVNWEGFSEPNIINAYWRNSLFFWSEEHAREFRAAREQINGVFLTLEQSAYSTRIAQGGLFAFSD